MYNMAGGRRRRICELFGISLPIIQAGMVWTSGAELAAASAEAGALGLLGAASMSPELLGRHIKKTQALTRQAIGVNIPLLYSRTEEQISVALDMGIKIFVTSAGSPKIYTARLKAAGATVVHVVSSPLLAKKCEDSGVDAVVAEGFEAGGHNGREETTTLALLPQVLDAVKIPVIAAGGLGSGAGIAACFALGAHGAQLGTRFAATRESSCHPNFKRTILEAQSGSTELCLKQLVPVRIVKNAFHAKLKELEARCASKEELATFLGKGRARRGIFEGDLDAGELEIGQISGAIRDLPSVSELVARLVAEYKVAITELVEA